MNIEDIKNASWLILYCPNTFYNRIVLRVVSIRFCYEQFEKKYYTLNCAIDESFATLKLIEYNGEFFVNVVVGNYDLIYTVKTTTNNVLEHLAVGDTLIFKTFNVDSNTPIHNTKAKITKIQKKYNRVLVNIFDESKNLSSVLKKYGTIHAVKTSDMRYLKEKGALNEQKWNWYDWCNDWCYLQRYFATKNTCWRMQGANVSIWIK